MDSQPGYGRFPHNAPFRGRGHFRGRGNGDYRGRGYPNGGFELRGRGDHRGRADYRGRADCQGRGDHRGRGDARGRGEPRGRGGYRGRGQYRGRGSAVYGQPPAPTQPTSPPPPCGPLIETIEVSELSEPAAAFTDSARVTDCSLLASYSWLDRKEATILIPGTPAKWTPPPEPAELLADSGVYFRDNNSARHPEHPMEPAVQAILAMQPEPFSKQIDLVACGSTIGSLLRFIRGEERPFRMLVEIVGGVLHLIRRENSPTETIPNVKGFGHTFPEAYTTWDADVRGSVSHQRLLHYDFGGLSCIVRHEGDGYLEDKLATASKGAVPRTRAEVESLDNLVSQMNEATIGPKMPGYSSSLHLQQAGFAVPQSAVFELKTRWIARKGEDFLGEQLPRMWVAQVPNFILAYHDKGVVNEIDVMDVSQKIKVWEQSMNKELSQLAALLHHIMDLARSSRDGKLEVIRQEGGKLEIRAQCTGAPTAFSNATMIRWEAWLSGEGDGTSGESDDEGAELRWSDDEGDYTACSEACKYCGHCTY